MLDVPWIALVRPVFALEPVGSWDDYATHDEGTFPWGSEFASGGLDPSEYQVADVKVVLLDILVMIAVKLLLVLGMLESSSEAVLFSRVDVGLPGSFSLALVIVLGVRGTKGDIRREDSLRAVDHEEGGVTGGPASLCA